MLASLGDITARMAESLEAPRWILLAVCVVGVFLAYITDEGYSLLLSDEGDMKSLKKGAAAGTAKAAAAPSASKKAAPGVAESGPAATPGSSWSILLKLFAPLSDLLPAFVLEALESFLLRLSKGWTKVQHYRSALALKQIATTKRQFFYLLEKSILELPIKDGETEIDTYVDCKDHLLANNCWPFMWEVSNVRADKVVCDGGDCIPMSSYSYLDLLRDDRVQSAAIEAAKQWSSGNHGPRMLGGNTSILLELERSISKFFGRDDTLLCATGYLACMSACAAIAAEDAVVFADSRLHASLRAGLKLGEAKIVNFRHNNFEDCERLIKQNRSKYNNAWMVIESVYSMDGDVCDLPAANALCKKYNISLMIDEAHGLGVVGKTGRGVEEHFGLHGCAKLLVGTFSKSIASIGGYISGDSKFIRYLDFHAAGNVFSAPLPAYCAGAAIKSFELIDEEPELVLKAQQNSLRLRELLETGGNYWPEGYPEKHKYEVAGEPITTVIPVIFPDDMDRLLRIATRMRLNGYMCSAVAYPACPLRTPRFRITATSAYTEDLMQGFVKTFIAACVAEAPSKFSLSLS